MLTKVEIINSMGQNLELPLDDYTAGYLVKDIEGLDPVKASMSTSGIATMDGVQYHSSRRDARNIIVRLELVPDYVTNTVEGLRRRLYGFAMPKTEVTLKFYIDDVYEVYATGRIESCEAPLFAQVPSADISIMCFDPDFYAAESIVYNGMTTDGYIRTDLQYDGTVEAGFVFKLLVDRAGVESISINFLSPSGDQQEFNWYNTLNPMGAGEELEVSTIPGNKYVYRTTDGVRNSAMASVTTNAMWFPLWPGINGISAWVSDAPVPYTLEYRPKFGGL